MSCSKTSQFLVCLTLAAIAAMSLADGTNAQQRPRSTMDRKTNQGKGFWENQRTTRSIQHAQSFSRDLYRYSRDAGNVAPEVAKAESEQLGKSIATAKKELAAVAKTFEGDKEVLTAVDSINKHLAKASEVHQQLHEECCKDAPDGSVTMECCSDITTELDHAAVEHGALIRKLEQRARPGAVTKPSKKN